MIAPDPDDPDIVYGNAVEKLDLRTEQTRNVDPTLAEPDLYRRTWTPPLVFSKTGTKALYFGNQKIFRTRDGGQRWDAISPDLTRRNPAVPPNLDAVSADHHQGIGERRGVVYAIAPSPVDARLIWAGTDDGLVWRSGDEGLHWADVTPAAMSAWSKVGMIEASHFEAAIAYVAVDRHRLDDRRPYIYRTRDAGATWQPIVAGIRDGDFVNAVREDPKRKGMLYAATERGVYVSFDDGAQWQTLQANLPRTSVRDIEVKGNDLVIATHGRGFWIMDDIAPLRQADARATGADAWLFAPSVALRLRVQSFTGTPLPKDESLASNPPIGAAIDYVLARAPAGAVRIAIYDARDQLVRSWSSTDAAIVAKPAEDAAAPEWMATWQPPRSTPGAHRFIWSLRYPLPAALVDGAATDGAWAPPGRYTVELDVDGKRQRQSLTIEPDPRVGLSDDDYAREFAFARRIEVSRARLAVVARESKTLHLALANAAPMARSDLAAAVRKLDAKVVALAFIVDAGNPHNAWSIPPNTTTNVRFVDQTLTTLYGAADGADAAPSPDALAGYAAIEPVLDRLIEAWSVLKRDDLLRSIDAW